MLLLGSTGEHISALHTSFSQDSHSFCTGYVGGTVLYRLLNHPDAKTFEITTIVREEAKAKKLEPYSVKTVIGSFKTDLALLTQEVEKVHVVFNCVSVCYSMSNLTLSLT